MTATPTGDSLRPIPVSSPASEENGTVQGQRKGLLIGAGIGLVVLVALAIVVAVLLVSNPVQAASVRDVVIIFMALEFMLIGVALVVLIFQIAVLTNMLQHEIKPILESTSETVSTLRGTAAFLSGNLVEPVIKLNAALAAVSQVLDTLNLFSRSGRKK